MTRPSQRWHELFQLFIALGEDYRDEFGSEDAALSAVLSDTPTSELRTAATQWHEAFDGLDDDGVREVASGLNSSYDPTRQFGGHREWAEWVRQHLEAELARR